MLKEAISAMGLNLATLLAPEGLTVNIVGDSHTALHLDTHSSEAAAGVSGDDHINRNDPNSERQVSRASTQIAGVDHV